MKNFILSIFVCCFFALPASAQVLIEEGKVVLSVQPGETVTDEIVIHNTSAKAFDVRVYWEDFTYQAPFTGTKQFSPAGTLERSAAEFVQYAPSSITLPAFAKKAIRYTVNVPKDASGGYYGVLFVERRGDQSEGKAGVEIVARVGSLFFIETKDSLKSASFSDVRLENGVLSGRIQNQGNVILIPEGIYYILDSKGLVADRGQTKKLYLPIDGQGDFSLSLPEKLSAGSYDVILTFDLDQGVSRVLEGSINVLPSGAYELSGWHE